MAEHNTDRGKRKAQHLLASEVLELVHSREEAIKTRNEHQNMRNPTIQSLSGDSTTQHEQAQQNSATETSVLPKSLVYATPFARILYHAGLVPTKSEGTRAIAKGGAYVGLIGHYPAGRAIEWSQIKEQQLMSMKSMLIDGKVILRMGKWKVRRIEVVDDEVFEKKGIDAPGWKEWKERQERT